QQCWIRDCSTFYSRTRIGNHALFIHSEFHGNLSRLLTIVVNAWALGKTTVFNRQHHVTITRSTLTVIARQGIAQLSTLVSRCRASTIASTLAVIFIAFEKSFRVCLWCHLFCLLSCFGSL